MYILASETSRSHAMHAALLLRGARSPRDQLVAGRGQNIYRLEI